MSIIVFTSHVPFDQPELAGISNFFKNLESLGHTVVLISNHDEELTDPWRLPYTEVQSRDQTLEASLMHEFRYEFKKWERRIDAWWVKKIGVSSGHDYVLNRLISSDSLLKTLNPNLLLIWNPYNPGYGVLHDLAKIRGIACGYLEWGIIDKSILIDPQGILSLSLLKEVSIQFLQQGKERDIWKRVGDDYLKSLQAGRARTLIYEPKKANDAGFEWFSSNTNSLRVLCLGCAEYQAGMFPLEHGDRIVNLPLFESGWHIADTLARNNDWKVLYKAHPNGSLPRPHFVQSDNLRESSVSAVDLIKAADVVLAWGTKLEINVLAFGKPLVLVGAGLLWNKGCAYEVSNAGDLPMLVEKAALNGVQSSQLKSLMIYLGWLIEEELFLFASDAIPFEGVGASKQLQYVDRFTEKFSEALSSESNVSKSTVNFFMAQLKRERTERRLTQAKFQKYSKPIAYYKRALSRRLSKISL